MLTIISFILTILGCINWLLIGLLQYDFVAGIFGYQASIFSRIIYVIVGVASLFLVFKMIKGKGTIAVFSRRNKKDLAKNIKKMGNEDDERKREEDAFSNSLNVESSREPHMRYDDYDKEYPHSYKSKGLFNEHFDDRDFRE